MLRTDDEKKIKSFSKFLSIPLINGLSPESHPAQILSDIFTIEEITKRRVSKLGSGIEKIGMQRMSSITDSKDLISLQSTKDSGRMNSSRMNKKKSMI